MHKSTFSPLITGSTGFVGQNLMPHLKYEAMYPVALSLRGSWKSSVPENATAYIHLAGKAHDTANTSSAADYFQINTELTKELFELFLQSEARDFIYFSSVKAAADTVEGILTEDVRPTPLTPYGQSKLQAEEYLLSKQLPTGKRVLILRPCMIHGPGNKGNLNLLYSLAKKGLPWPLGAFHNQRSFLSIQNLNFVITELLKRPDVPSGIYNVADDESLSTNQLIELIAQVRKQQPKIWSLPSGIIRSAARLGDTLHLPLNSERLKKLTESYVVDNSKLKQVLNLHQMPISVKEGLSITLRSFE
jgi:nucleoside-diphosphate-sugar epimerase